MSRTDCTDVCEIVMHRLTQMGFDVGWEDEDNHDKVIEALEKVVFVKDEEYAYLVAVKEIVEKREEES